ncbi:uncharacterized protein LOC114527847 [Dendronephthya gigantea]|uniref:uncharacterized protein LOC114527847 n=1 Tax=Dendronephthya gigantea TaxID=151771 RepID=UPI00106BD337|nr:uncharacterized protein LOC114527847 [Dendronephthya gigantea]
MSMVLKWFLVSLSLCSAVSAASMGANNANKQAPQGYLVLDTSAPTSCYDIPNNTVCPSFSHQVPGADAMPTALALVTLQNVQVELNRVAVFKGTRDCLEDLREYSCSNSLMQCTPNKQSPYGFVLEYNVTRTRQACENVKKSCSSLVQAATIHNCSIIQTNPYDFAICEKHTVVPGDVCSRTDYMYPKAFTKFYPINTNGFKAQIFQFSQVANIATNDACLEEFKDVYCNILRGPICALMTKRIFAISQQDCSKTITKCIVNPGHKAHLLEVCKLLPDENFPKIDLPVVSNSNNAGNSAAGK